MINLMRMELQIEKSRKLNSQRRDRRKVCGKRRVKIEKWPVLEPERSEGCSLGLPAVHFCFDFCLSTNLE